jgi:hypothetical protein
MRFQEPERFVQVARCSGKDVRGIRIASLDDYQMNEVIAYILSLRRRN